LSAMSDRCAPQACAGPSVQISNCIGSARESGAATGPELVASNRQVAAALAAAANRIIRRPPASGTMPERPPSSALGGSREFLRVTAHVRSCKSRTDSRCSALLYGDQLRSSAFQQRSVGLVGQLHVGQ
jgi:hypothetical protein